MSLSSRRRSQSPNLNQAIATAGLKKAEMASSTLNTLGDFDRLPPEVRLLIFDLLFPETFRQVYTVTDNGIVPDRRRSSNPCFLRVSKQVHDEILQAMLTDTTCKVRIDLETITTNFIGSFRKIHYPHPGVTSFRLPACKMLDITIIPPSPRNTRDFVQTRKAVQQFVDIVNNSTCDILPKTLVRLEHQANGGGFRCGYNDFAMLMGPLSKLQKPCRGGMIYRTTGWYSFAPDIERQCDLIERAVAGSEEANMLFTYQQRMLDVKLPLCMFESNEQFQNRFNEHRQRAALDSKAAAAILGACCALYIWSKTHNKPRPDWLDTLSIELMARRTPSATLLGQIFEGYGMRDMGYWAAGLMTRINPFWTE